MCSLKYFYQINENALSLMQYYFHRAQGKRSKDKGGKGRKGKDGNEADDESDASKILLVYIIGLEVLA